MIQRVQSVWLFIACAALLSMFLFPVVTQPTTATELIVKVSGLYNKTGEISKQVQAFLPLSIAFIVTALVSFINIFNFKNRTLQKRICLLIVILILGATFWLRQTADGALGGLDTVKYGTGAFMPSVAVLCCVLAFKAINRDEKLIRSADRLR